MSSTQIRYRHQRVILDVGTAKLLAFGMLGFVNELDALRRGSATTAGARAALVLGITMALGRRGPLVAGLGSIGSRAYTSEDS